MRPKRAEGIAPNPFKSLIATANSTVMSASNCARSVHELLVDKFIDARWPQFATHS